jgi:hypothetical protein
MIDEFALFQLVFSSQEIGDRRLFYLFSPHPTPYTPHPTPYTLFQVRAFVDPGTL